MSFPEVGEGGGGREITKFTMFAFLSDLLDAFCGECGHHMYQAIFELSIICMKAHVVM